MLSSYYVSFIVVTLTGWVTGQPVKVLCHLSPELWTSARRKL